MEQTRSVYLAWCVTALVSLAIATLSFAKDSDLGVRGNCTDDRCILAQTIVSMDNPNGEKVSKKVEREYYVPGSNIPRKAYDEITEIDQHTCTKKIIVPRPVYEAVMEAFQSSRSKTKLTEEQSALIRYHVTLSSSLEKIDCGTVARTQSQGDQKPGGEN